MFICFLPNYASAFLVASSLLFWVWETHRRQKNTSKLFRKSVLEQPWMSDRQLTSEVLSFSHVWSLHVHIIEIHQGLTSNLVCSFGAVINASAVERSIKCAENSVHHEGGWGGVQQQNCEKHRRGGKGCGYMRQDHNGKRGTCSLLDAPKTTAEDTFCTRSLKNPQHNKASIKQKVSTKPSFKEATKHQSSSTWLHTVLLSSSSSITSSSFHHSSLTLSTIK